MSTSKIEKVILKGIYVHKDQDNTDVHIFEFAESTQE